MRATALVVTETTAIVELRPSWLGRIFGASTSVIHLERRAGAWFTAATGRPLAERHWDGEMWIDTIPEGAAILRALDFRPVGPVGLLPEARARSRA